MVNLNNFMFRMKGNDFVILKYIRIRNVENSLKSSGLILVFSSGQLPFLFIFHIHFNLMSYQLLKYLKCPVKNECASSTDLTAFFGHDCRDLW